MPILAQKFFVDNFVKLFDTLNYAKKILVIWFKLYKKDAGNLVVKFII